MGALKSSFGAFGAGHAALTSSSGCFSETGAHLVHLVQFIRLVHLLHLFVRAHFFCAGDFFREASAERILSEELCQHTTFTVVRHFFFHQHSQGTLSTFNTCWTQTFVLKQQINIFSTFPSTFNMNIQHQHSHTSESTSLHVLTCLRRPFGNRGRYSPPP
jgi:hypothetical protein